tara:strand:- start:35 stop:232 length:198 start_codon:yes stop_codon:yes gene_type:complete
MASKKKAKKKTTRKKRKELTERQKQALIKHAKHHTPKHMAYMRREMRGGATFTQAHKKAMKKVGK